VLKYDEDYSNTFHSPGLEPWLVGLFKSVEPKAVLDIGCGLGFWGLVLKGYLGVAYVVGVDIDPSKVEFVRSLDVYDELYVSDVRLFEHPRIFDAVLAVESLHGILNAELLDRLEGLVKRGGLVVLTLPRLSKELRVIDLTRRSYRVYRYLLRGFLLVRDDGCEILTTPGSIWRLLGLILRILGPLLRLVGFLSRGYLIAYKVV
jgi:SAM-dependent methyltransferase